MKESELMALISLLEDDDPRVKNHIEAKLVSLGEGVIPRLEAVWENAPDEWMQGRIEDVIQLIQSKSTIESLRAWRAEGGANLLKGWFLVSQYLYPEIKYQTFHKAVNRLVNRIWLELRSSMSVPEQLMVISRMLFVKERYKINQKNPPSAQQYLINKLVDSKKGTPLSLGLLYMIICEELKIPVYGIILPEYFVLTFQNQKTEFFIDIFDKVPFFSRDDLKQYLKKMKVQEDPSYFEPSSKIYLILELIRRMILAFSRAKDKEKISQLEELLRGIEIDR